MLVFDEETEIFGRQDLVQLATDRVDRPVGAPPDYPPKQKQP